MPRNCRSGEIARWGDNLGENRGTVAIGGMGGVQDSDACANVGAVTFAWTVGKGIDPNPSIRPRWKLRSPRIGCTKTAPIGPFTGFRAGT